MVTLLYHSNAIGPICKRIAQESDGQIQALSDRATPTQIGGTLIRWDSRSPIRAERELNAAESVRLSRNKKKSRMRLEGLCPPTWFKLDQIPRYDPPVLIRPQHHYGAHGFHVVRDRIQAIEAMRMCGRQKWYASPLIPKDVEFRVFVFQGYGLKVVRRFHDDPSQIAWNIANGGRSVRVKRGNWPIPVVRAAIQAGEKVDLDWYAADVIVAGDTPYVLELNTAPGLNREETFDSFAGVFGNPLETRNTQIGDTCQTLLHPTLR